MFDSTEAFLFKATTFLLENETSNFQIIGAATTHQFGTECWCTIVTENGLGEDSEAAVLTPREDSIVFAAVLTPARLLMSKCDMQEAITLFVKTALENNKQILRVKANEGAVELLSKELKSQADLVEVDPSFEIGYVMEHVSLDTITTEKDYDDLKKTFDSGYLREVKFPEDVDKFLTCHETEGDDVGREKITEDLIEKSKHNKSYFWCMEADSGKEQVVAIAAYALFSDNLAVVRGVYTPSYARGKGYGTAISYKLTELLLQVKGIRKVVLSVARDNLGALKAYKRCGYVVKENTKMVKYEKPC